MNRSFFPIIPIIIWTLIVVSCRDAPDQTRTQTPETATPVPSAIYHGILPSPEYDSIVNDLTLYPDETFDLIQVDRIAEHHLNEKKHDGIYVYLADSTRLGLYSTDGYLMLQFLLTTDGMIPMIVHSDQVISDSIEWIRLESAQ